jgi:hypothetical protein
MIIVSLNKQPGIGKTNDHLEADNRQGESTVILGSDHALVLVFIVECDRTIETGQFVQLDQGRQRLEPISVDFFRDFVTIQLLLFDTTG